METKKYLQIDKNHIICDAEIYQKILDFIDRFYFKKGIASDKQIYLLDEKDRLYNLKFEKSNLSSINVNYRLKICLEKDSDSNWETKKIKNEFQICSKELLLSTCIEELMKFHEIHKKTTFKMSLDLMHLQNELFFTEHFFEDIRSHNINIFEIFVRSTFNDFIEQSIQTRYNLSNSSNCYIYFENLTHLNSVIKFLEQEKIAI